MNFLKYIKKEYYNNKKITYNDIFHFLPKEISDIIIDYKKDIELYEYYDNFIKYLKEIKKNDYETIFYYSFYNKTTYLNDIIKLINIELNKNIELIHYYRRKKINKNITKNIYRITIKIYKNDIHLYYL